MPCFRPWPMLVLALVHPASVAAQTPGLDDAPQIVRPEPASVAELTRHAQTLYGVGLMEHRAEHILQATTLLEDAVQLDPDTAEPHRILITLYEFLGRDLDVIHACRAVVARDPDDHRTWHRLAEALRDADQLADAIKALRQGLQSPKLSDQPEQIVALQEDLARFLEEADDLDDAETVCRELIATLVQHHDRLIRDGHLGTTEIEKLLAQSYEHIGQLCLAQKRFDQATTAFVEAQRRFADATRAADPEQAARLDANLAEVRIAQSQWLLALGHLDAYLARQPIAIEPYQQKIKVLRALNRSFEVVPALRRYAERMPDHVGLQLLLARELSQVPDRFSVYEAEAMLRELAEESPTAEVYRELCHFYERQSRLGEILQLFDEMLTITDDEEADEKDRERVGERGRALHDALREEPELVNRLITRAVDDLQIRASHEFGTWRILAMLADHTNQLGHAEALYRQAMFVAGRRSRGEIILSLLDVLWRANKLEAVDELCRSVLVNKPFSIPAVGLHYRRAMALTLLGRYDEALVAMDSAIDAAGSGVLERKVQRTQILRVARRYDQALAECEALMQEYQAPSDVREIRMALSQIYSAMGRHDESEAELRRILDIDPNDATANNNLGYQMAERGIQLAEAERLIRRAIALDRAQRRFIPDDEPENAAFLDSLGWVLFRQGELDEAERLLRQAAQLPEGRDDPVVWDHLGDVCYRKGDTAEAIQAWTRSQELFQTQPRDDPHDRAAEVARKLRQVNNLQ